jgi:cryptochrome
MKSIHWFRKGIRLHDNLSLIEACKNAQRVYPVYCLDPYFADPSKVGINRYSFLLQSLQDLDESLRKLGSRLFVLKGKPEDEIIRAIEQWEITKFTYESDTEPYAKIRDARITKLLKDRDIEVVTYPSHTLHPMEQYFTRSRGHPPTTYQSFEKIFKACGPIREPVEAPSSLPSVSASELTDTTYDVPTLTAMGYTDTPTTPFMGGETEALLRLERFVLERKTWVNTFAKPETAPNSIEPSTTVGNCYL